MQNSGTLAQAGQEALIWDCPGHSGTVGNYAVGFVIAFGAISLDPQRHPVVQIEPTSFQAVKCGQFCLQ